MCLNIYLLVLPNLLLNQTLALLYLQIVDQRDRSIRDVHQSCAWQSRWLLFSLHWIRIPSGPCQQSRSQHQRIPWRRSRTFSSSRHSRARSIWFLFGLWSGRGTCSWRFWLPGRSEWLSCWSGSPRGTPLSWNRYASPSSLSLTLSTPIRSLIIYLADHFCLSSLFLLWSRLAFFSDCVAHTHRSSSNTIEIYLYPYPLPPSPSTPR